MWRSPPSDRCTRHTWGRAGSGWGKDSWNISKQATKYCFNIKTIHANLQLVMAVRTAGSAARRPLLLPPRRPPWPLPPVSWVKVTSKPFLTLFGTSFFSFFLYYLLPLWHGISKALLTFSAPKYLFIFFILFCLAKIIKICVFLLGSVIVTGKVTVSINHGLPEHLLHSWKKRKILSQLI